MPPSATPRQTRIACAQIAPRVGDVDHNLRIALDAIERAAAAGADVLVLPELTTSGYVFTSCDEARSLAEPPDGRSLSAWVEAAGRHGLTVVGGFLELADDGTLFNSAAVVDGHGPRLVYRKVHLWDRELLVFTPGSEPPPVLDLPFGRLSVAVCYDLEFAEYMHVIALAGADLVCIPTNWPRYPRPEGERPMELIRGQATASTNRIFVAACDRHGIERGVDWVGGSVIIDENGWLLQGPPADFGEALLVADLDLARARDKTLNERNDVFADRIPDLYAAAAARARERSVPVPDIQGGSDGQDA